MVILKTENCHETRREKADKEILKKKFVFDEKKGIIRKGKVDLSKNFVGYCFSKAL